MIAYLDTSVLLRIALNQRAMLAEWDEITEGVTSVLTRVEAYRTLHRLEWSNEVTGRRVADARRLIDAVLEYVEEYEVTSLTISLASQTLPRPLRTLDAIHLATAIQYRNEQPADEPPIRIATHDRAFARVARLLGFRAMGTAPD